MAHDTTQILKVDVTTLRRAALMMWGDLGGWLYDTFARLNARCFDGLLPPVPLLWGLTGHGAALALCGPRVILLHQSLVAPRHNPWGLDAVLGKKFATDVLLHEMMHLAIRQAGGSTGETSHNCPEWADEINRIAPIIGLVGVRAEQVKPRRVNGVLMRKPRDGFLTQAQLASFPHALRPPHFYGGDVDVTAFHY